MRKRKESDYQGLPSIVNRMMVTNSWCQHTTPTAFFKKLFSLPASYEPSYKESKDTCQWKYNTWQKLDNEMLYDSDYTFTAKWIIIILAHTYSFIYWYTVRNQNYCIKYVIKSFNTYFYGYEEDVL